MTRGARRLLLGPCVLLLAAFFVVPLPLGYPVAYHLALTRSRWKPLDLALEEAAQSLGPIACAPSSRSPWA